MARRSIRTPAPARSATLTSALRQRLRDIEIGCAGTDYAQLRGVGADGAIETIVPGVGPSGTKPKFVDQLLLARYRVRADRRLRVVLPDLPVDSQPGFERMMAAGVEIDGADTVRHRGDDLESDPGAGVPRHPERVHSEVENILLITRNQHGHTGIGEGVLTVARERGRLRRRIIAAEHHRAATRSRPHRIGVFEHVPGAVQTRPFAVPGAHDAVDLGVGQRGAHLTSPYGGRGEFLVESGPVHDPMPPRPVLLEFQIESAQRRPRVSGNHRRGAQSGTLIQFVAQREQTHQRLHPRQHRRRNRHG